MKYNLDCIRAVLIKLQDLIQIKPSGRYEFVHTPICIFDLLKELSNEDVKNPFSDDDSVINSNRDKSSKNLFSTADIVYSVEKLDEAGYIKTQTNSQNMVYITSITFSGHEFMEMIKPPDKWEQVKATVIKIGCAALSVVGEISKSYIMNKLGI